MTRRTSRRRSSRNLRTNHVPKISPTAQRVLVEHVWASDSLDAAISDFERARTDEIYLPGGERLRADDAAAVLRSWKPSPLPKNGKYITVYHATDRETADRLLREGVIPQLKPTNLAMLRHEAGEYAEFAPGRGISRGFYVADADIAKGFGRVLLELHVPESFIELPPEQQQELPAALHNEDGAVITRPVPSSAISEVVRKNGAGRVLDLNVLALLPLRQKGNPIEQDKSGVIDGKMIRGESFEYYEALIASMKRYGLREPIVIAAWGRKPHLVEGHHRLSAAWELGWKTIPTLVDASITDEMLKKLGAM